MNDDMLNYTGRSSMENKEDWRGWISKLPFIQFPAEWKIKVIPPFGGALARFVVQLPSGEIKSVYFDAYNSLGRWPRPYWEVYPFKNDVGRCNIGDVAKLLEMIADETGEGS
jgi:hypothetical protein